MTTLAIIGFTLLAAVVWFVEKLAFAILTLLVWSWAVRASRPLRLRIEAAYLRYTSPVRHALAMWLLRRQMAAGATP